MKKKDIFVESALETAWRWEKGVIQQKYLINII